MLPSDGEDARQVDQFGPVDGEGVGEQQFLPLEFQRLISQPGKQLRGENVESIMKET